MSKRQKNNTAEDDGYELRRMTHQYFELKGDTVVFTNLRIAKFDFEISDAVSIQEITRAYFPSKEVIRTIPYNLFRKFPCVKTLSMSRCFAETLGSQRFENALHLETFVFDGNFVEEIGDYTFIGAPNLEDMSLCNNGIRYLFPESLDGLSNLTILHLTGNRLSYINPDLFQYLISLEELLLNQNNISIIRQNTFSKNLNLKILNLSINRVIKIGAEVLLKLNLDLLNLTQNDLATLTTGNVRFLDLRSNYGLEDLIIQGHCEELLLDRTDLRTIHVANWDNLKKISLRKVTNLNPSFLKFANNLEEINLSGMELETIQKDLFEDMYRLKYLNLNNNKLKILDIDIFLKCKNIEILCLDDNELTEVDFAKLVDVLKRLKDISFSQNLFTSVYYENMEFFFKSKKINVSRDFAIHTFR